ncbi:TonB family protein [Candidatus Neomarinimicrobiota bacterium]
MTSIWDSITGNTTSILQSLVMNEARTSLAIIMVLALDYLLRHWNPRLRYALWLVVLFQALWPPTFRIPAFTIWSATPVQLLPAGLVAGSSSAAVLPGGINSTVWILALWGAASVVVILWMAVAFFDLRWKLRGAQLLKDSPPIIETLATRWKPSVLVSHRIHSPLAIGLFRPKIYLTPAAAQMEEHTLRAILYHETAHILRLDHWVIFVQVLALILHPFNPLVWLMNRRLARYREQICDDFALQHTDIAPVTYGHLLLDYVAQGAFNRPALLPRTLFCESRNDLRQRLTQLLSRKETTMNRTSILQKLSLVAILLAMVFVSSQCQEESSALTLQEQHDLQAALTESNPEFAPEGSSGLTEEEQKQRQAELTELGVEFVSYDEPPKPVGGLGAISELLIYPEKAKEKGLAGKVIVNCQVMADGRTGQVAVVENETGDKSLEEAALAAVRQITWIPAKQRDKNVAVWIAIPISFSLDNKPTSDKIKD